MEGAGFVHKAGLYFPVGEGRVAFTHSQAQRILETAVIPSGADPWDRPAKEHSLGSRSTPRMFGGMGGVPMMNSLFRFLRKKLWGLQELSFGPRLPPSGTANFRRETRGGPCKLAVNDEGKLQ